MKLRAIHLFMILILSLILCSFLGGLSGCMREGMQSDLSTTSNQVKTGSYTGPAGDTVNTYSNDATGKSAAVGPNGNVVTADSSDNYNGYNSNDVSSTSYNNAYGSATTYTGPQGNSVSTVSSNGIYANQIPAGDEDLYILKSQIVPPVCPACPSNSTCPRTEAPPPCPPCARCPEPAFECKKVPNYRANDDSYLPRPVLSDFSQFGM
uniref:Uncharacterized protein n=1 Tax=viral metagenome TaxID=1070528 RepID=A0A6C0LI21_9ZZZZ